MTIAAPLGRLFLLSTRVELVKETLGMTLVRNPGAGYVSEGFVVGGSRVHWRGWKFGLPTEHHTLITGFAEPHEVAPGVMEAWFQDTQERGRFAFFRHDHYFRETVDPVSGQPVTVLSDAVRFRLPFGFLGAVAAQLLLGPHIRRLVRQRYERLQGLAVGQGWREWVEG